jgi:cbb3-type cytochrome oxidase subunit 3
MWSYIYILSTILVCVSCIGLLLWVFRPNSKSAYDECSMIPLRDELVQKDIKNTSDNGREKNR